MQIRILPLLILLSLLIVATACSATLAAEQASPSSEPAPAAVVTSAPTASGNSPAVANAKPAPIAVTLPAETRTDSAGSVTVEVTPKTGAAGMLVFDVIMNTHSVELEYDLTKIATLRDDQGRVYEVKGWEGSTGGHHRQGILTFEAMGGPAPKWLELNLSGISGVSSRLFRWDVAEP